MVIDCPEGWKLIKLSDLGEVNRGRSRHRPRHAPFLYGGPYPFIQTADIKASGGRITEYSQTYSEAGLAQSRLWPSGTMCITIAANIAETGILTFPACFPDSVIGFVGDKDKCEVRFIEYMFRHLKRFIQHEASESGTVQDNINLGYLEQMKFPIPSLPEQHAIAHILGALDDKIELNRRMNHTLEAMARGLFKSWFVDFDPVTAKAEGRVPFGMNVETMSLFPAEFVETKVEPIPLGWEVGSILKFANLLSGGTPSTHKPEYWDGDIAWVSAKDVSAANGFFVLSTERTISDLGLENSSAKLLPAKTTIVTARGTVGKYCILGREMSMNQTNYGLRAKDEANHYFTYFSLVFLVEQLQQNSYGTIFDTITTRTFQDSRTIVPSTPVIEAFEKRVTPMMNMILDNTLQVQTLTSIRDALLPKLLSGELRVKQAEKVIENM